MNTVVLWEKIYTHESSPVGLPLFINLAKMTSDVPVTYMT